MSKKRENNMEEIEEESLPISSYSISSFGADYVVQLLVQKLDKKDIIIAKFQRKFIWNIIKASKFVESLILGLPVPEIFFTKDSKGRLLVVDGQQRLRTIQLFYSGNFSELKPFRLTGLKSEYNGYTYNTLPEKAKRDLDNAAIHAVIFVQDKPEYDFSSIYEVYERLNTGGSILYPHEVRTAINFDSEFVKLLEELNSNENWRYLFGKVDKRLRDKELILRFFALFYNKSNYESPMKDFLNKFIKNNNDLHKYTKEQLTDIFNNNVRIIREKIGRKAFKPFKGLNAAIFDSIMVGIANLAQKRDATNVNIKKIYNNLLMDTEFVKACTTTTASANNVRKRLKKSIEAFTK